MKRNYLVCIKTSEATSLTHAPVGIAPT